MLSTQIRRIPFVFSILVVLLITLLLCLALLRFSGVLGSVGGADPNGVSKSSLIDPNGVVSSGILNPNGIAAGPAINPDGLAAGCGMDPNGGSCQRHAGGLLASGVSIDGNGAS
jgi:hypothetical protein